MKRMFVVLITFSVVVLYSCVQKRYTYERVDDNEEKELVREVFFYENDSLAYIYALNLFHKYRLEANTNNLDEDAVQLPLPISFRLYDDENNDISQTCLKEPSITEDSIVNIYNNLIEQKKGEYLRSLPQIDTIAAERLRPFFRVEKDEFSKEGRAWYTPSNAPKYVNINAFYPYFMTSGKYNLASNLRIKFQYAGSNWLFIRELQFSIDGDAYEYILSDVKRDNNTTIWEWSDDRVNQNIYEILQKIAVSKNAKIKITGSDYHKIKTISSQQKLDIKRTLEYYEALGGEEPQY